MNNLGDKMYAGQTQVYAAQMQQKDAPLGSEIQEILSDTQRRIAALAAGVEALGQRLTPVLRASPPENPTGAARTTRNSPIGEQLQADADRLSYIGAMVGDLIERLQV